MSLTLGLLIGLVLGLTGAGGSVLAVPALMLGLGWSLTDAAPVALIAVCTAATVGTAAAWDVSYVRYRAAILMATAGLVVAPLGLLAARALPATTLHWFFSAVLVAVAARMLWQARQRPDETRIVRADVHGDGVPARGPLCRLHEGSGRLKWTRPCAFVISAIGAVTGFLSGLLGVGGGFVIVPSLRSATALSMHSAVATSLMAIALTSAGTVLVVLLSGQTLPWMTALPFAAGALGGMLAGRRLAPRVAGPILQQGFAALMVATATVLLSHST